MKYHKIIFYFISGEIFKEEWGAKSSVTKKNPPAIFHLLFTKINICNKTKNFSSSTENCPDFVPTVAKIFHFPQIGQKSFIT
jgi:hypothetical protein